MEVPGAPALSEVSPELLEPLVTALATLGELGAMEGDIPLEESPRATSGVVPKATSLRSRLLSLLDAIHVASRHRYGVTARLRRALADVSGASADVPGAAANPWVAVVAAARRWREAVASVEETWATVTGDAASLSLACSAEAAAAAAAATAGAPPAELLLAVAREEEAMRRLLEATRNIPVAAELGEAREALAEHREEVAEAGTAWREAAEVTFSSATALVASAKARGVARVALSAQRHLRRLVAACRGATYFYCLLRCRLQKVEAAAASLAEGSPRERGGGGPAVPRELEALVGVAERLWEASARLAKGHLEGILDVTGSLLVTADGAEAAEVARRCQEAVAAIPGLLEPGPQR